MNVTVERLRWKDQSLGSVSFPRKELELRTGFGSGLTRQAGDPPNLIWAVCDRGPNLSLDEAQQVYGWKPPAARPASSKAKIMPRLDLGPTLAQLRVDDDEVVLLQTIRLLNDQGQPVSGLPVPASEHAECEPALNMNGEVLTPDPEGMDTEGVAALRDGSFWVSEEYGPSLAKVASDGRILLRLTPEGVDLAGAGYPVEARLPAIAARRYLNRGFEALAASPSEARLFLSFQSPLGHPDKAAHEGAKHVRICQLDSAGALEAQYLYALDPPETFRRDVEKGEFGAGDLKLCEMIALSETKLLTLERGSETTKIYHVEVADTLRLGPEHLDVQTRPTIEELSADGHTLPALTKTLLFSSDEHRAMSADMEGMVLLDERNLLLVSDNDFGIGGKETAFFRLRFEEPLTRG